MAYTKLGPFVDVPDQNNPPPGADPLSAATMNHFEDGLADLAADADAAVAGLAGKADTNDARIANAVRAVKHGATANTARPAGAVSVIWSGTVEPTNMTDDDLWIAPA